jgi:toxin ParE1/3/4
MARYRLSPLAEDDLAHILATSEDRWGAERRRHYAAIIVAAMRKVAADPNGPATRDRAELSTGVRSFHLRHARSGDPGVNVKRPVHVLFYRAVAPGLIEIVRVLHERMEPRRHLTSAEGED